MAVINSSAHPSALWPGVQAFFGMKYKEIPTEYTQVFDVRSSDKWKEEVVETIGFGYAEEKPEGQSVSYDTTSEGYSTDFIHKAYAKGYIVTKEELEDNLYTEVSRRRGAALSRAMRCTAELVHANILNRQQNASYVGGDGVELVSDAHPTANGTQSNELTAADLSETSLETAVTAVMNATDSRGLRMQLRPTRLIVSTTDVFNATRILRSELQNDTDTNAVNAIKLMGSVPEMLMMHYLDDADAWFLQTDAPDGLICYDRVPVELSKDQDFDTDNAKAKARHRYSAGWGDWRAIYGNAGTG